MSQVGIAMNVVDSPAQPTSASWKPLFRWGVYSTMKSTNEVNLRWTLLNHPQDVCRFRPLRVILIRRRK